jgi:uncharacterized membrane protein
MNEKNFNLVYIIGIITFTCLIVANYGNIVKFATINGGTFVFIIVLGIIYCFSLLLFFIILLDFFQKNKQ